MTAAVARPSVLGGLSPALNGALPRPQSAAYRWYAASLRPCIACS
jgi:hypothetical protein